MFEADINQATLFGTEPLSVDPGFANLERIDLDGEAWVDYAPLWLNGDECLFGALVDGAPWSQPVVKMYDREVLTPRLVAPVSPALHPMISEMTETLSNRYLVRLDQVSAGWYRNGDDSVAFHGDRIARERNQAVVATVSLGGPRRFLLRPKAGGQSLTLSLGHGDLVVMGGTCQRTWEHAVPKARRAPPRIALMFRHAYA